MTPVRSTTGGALRGGAMVERTGVVKNPSAARKRYAPTGSTLESPVANKSGAKQPARARSPPTAVGAT